MSETSDETSGNPYSGCVDEISEVPGIEGVSQGFGALEQVAIFKAKEGAADEVRTLDCVDSVEQLSSRR